MRWKKRIAGLLHSERAVPARHFDIELTNSCNAACIFCPRDKTPRQGFMSFETFARAVQRVGELGDSAIVHICGLGEPLLHPNVAEMVNHLSKKGLPPSVTTNAYLLTRELSHRLVDAGLREIVCSVSGIDDNYKKIHRLDFEVVRRNIVDFIRVSKRRSEIVLSMTVCDPIKDEMDKLEAYWKSLGIHRIVIFDQINRGGALDMGYDFVDNEVFCDEAEAIMTENKIDYFCLAPHIFSFIGWDGNYYMCCHDYRKRLPLGSVFEYSVEEIDSIRMQSLEKKPIICKNCDISTTNRIRDILFRIKKDEATQSELDEEIGELKRIGETHNQRHGG
jgi:MoaA/NifB/PqqE/SkfB family radical SAM enzyme